MNPTAPISTPAGRAGISTELVASDAAPHDNSQAGAASTPAANAASTPTAAPSGPATIPARPAIMTIDPAIIWASPSIMSIDPAIIWASPGRPPVAPAHHVQRHVRNRHAQLYGPGSNNLLSLAQTHDTPQTPLDTGGRASCEAMSSSSSDSDGPVVFTPEGSTPSGSRKQSPASSPTSGEALPVTGPVPLTAEALAQAFPPLITYEHDHRPTLHWPRRNIRPRRDSPDSLETRDGSVRRMSPLGFRERIPANCPAPGQVRPPPSQPPSGACPPSQARWPYGPGLANYPDRATTPSDYPPSPKRPMNEYPPGLTQMHERFMELRMEDDRSANEDGAGGQGDQAMWAPEFDPPYAGPSNWRKEDEELTARMTQPKWDGKGKGKKRAGSLDLC